MGKIGNWRASFIVALLVPFPVCADWYSATAAADKQDFARAFELYRELAEMGHREAQENLAVMYVNGEGVARDNVLGYAWAAIAIESGGGDSARGIMDQLEPHLTEAARARVAQVQSLFGRDALQKTLLPTKPDASIQPKSHACRMKVPVDPDVYYPPKARKQGISGVVVMETVVYGDGRDHNPRVWYSFPPQVFENAGIEVALRNQATPHVVDGVTVPCTMRFRVKFELKGTSRTALAKKELEELRVKAEAGDPRSQFIYALVMEGRQDLFEGERQAPEWYLKAAQAGVPGAQHVVGARVLAGFGYEKDERKGLAWLDKAAGAGNANAQLELANHLIRVYADAKAFVAAQALMRRAVEGGNYEAQFYLAAVLAAGPDASQRDPALAIKLMAKVMDDFGSNPIAYEIRAAARAHSGDFETAKVDQSHAVRIAKKLGWDTAPQEARLKGYAAGQTFTGDLFAFY